eukprot:761819-Hanusia_phi.AAC.2
MLLGLGGKDTIWKYRYAFNTSQGTSTRLQNQSRGYEYEMSLTLDEQYKNTRKLSMTIESIMTKVSTSPLEQARELLDDVNNKLNDTKGLLVSIYLHFHSSRVHSSVSAASQNSMDQLVLSEPAAKKDLWRNKVQVGNLREEFESLSRLYERERKRSCSEFLSCDSDDDRDQESLGKRSRRKRVLTCSMGWVTADSSLNKIAWTLNPAWLCNVRTL